MRPIAFDLETHAIQPGVLAPRIVCASFWPSQQPLMLRDAAMPVIESLVRPGATVAGANIAYDFGCVAATWPNLLPLILTKLDLGEVHDVQIAQTLDSIAKGLLRDEDGNRKLIDPLTRGPLIDPGTGKMAMRYSLASCVYLNLGRKDAKVNDEWRLRYGELDGIPLDQWPDVAKVYPVDDARNTWEVACIQLGRCENLHDMPAQCRAAFALHLSAMWGLRTDGASVDALEKDLLAKQRELTTRFTAVGWIRPDGTKDTKALKTAVEVAYHGDPPRTEKGATSTARDTLEDSGDADLEAFAEVSKVDKLLGTYVPFVREGTQTPINLRPNVLVASGRTSYDGLIQLLPRKGGIRECFTARTPGYVYCSVDYAAIELSTLAQVCLWLFGKSELARAINQGADPHTDLAASMHARRYEDMLALVRGSDPWAKDQRTAAKAGNFGFPGGMGAPAFVQAKRKEGIYICETTGHGPCSVVKVKEWRGRLLDMPQCSACLDQAAWLRDQWFARWVEMRAYFEWVSGTLDGSDGRLVQFVSKRIRGGLSFCSGANTLFQGLAADGAKAALWDVTKACFDRGSPLYGSRPVVFAHDEIIAELREDQAHEAAHEMARLMVEAMKRYVPDVAVKAEPALMRRWYKSAEPVFVGGRLTPWEPPVKVSA